MANLGEKTATGLCSFKKYVTNLDQIYVVEDKKTAIIQGKVYGPGTELKILCSDMVMLGRVRCVSVMIDGAVDCIPINRIRKPTTVGDGTHHEDRAVNIINEVISGTQIDISLGDTIYPGISAAVKVDDEMKKAGGCRYDPKADFVLCQDILNPLSSGSIYISHKAEGGPDAFQQYGGISSSSGIEINENQNVQKFLRSVADHIVDEKLPHPMLGRFDDEALANKTIFGPEFGGVFSLNHTQAIGQGDPVMTLISEGCYSLDFSSHMSLSGDLTNFTEGYTPVLGASFRSGRSFRFEGVRHKGARVGFYPLRLFDRRTDLVSVDL